MRNATDRAPTKGRRQRWGLLLLQASLLPLAVACVRKPFPPGRDVVAGVELTGVGGSMSGAILQGLSTHESERFLGIWDGVAFDYQVYDQELLARDLERVERYLRARGYYEAKVVVARVVHIDRHRVRVEIRVTQGAPVITRNIALQGLQLLPIDVSSEVLRVTQVRSGRVFDEQQYEDSKRDILRVLQNFGYAFAKVTGAVSVDLREHIAEVAINVEPGATATLGPIRITGLRHIPEQKVRFNLGLKTGDRYSREDLEDAGRALGTLGVFTQVSVTPELDKATGSVVPVHVRVEESRLRAIRIGVGAKLDALQLSNHVSVGWEHKNLFGGTRHFKADARPGLVYFPTRFGKLTTPNRALFASKVHVELEQPSLFDGRTSGVISGDFNLFPLLFAETSADEALLGFTELKGALGLRRAFWGHRLIIAPSYNWQLEMPLDYAPLSIGRSPKVEGPLLDDLEIAYPELVAYLDLRDNALDPRRGAFLGMSLQVANRALSGDLVDYRVKPEARFYIRISRPVTLALRAGVGFLIPQDYGDTFDQDPTQADPDELARDQLKLLFRGFFSGGANSNRGYPLRGVGPKGPVPFSVGDRPLGGITLWEGSFELRFPILGPLRAALFADTSNISRQFGLDFTAPHFSPGVGLRYGTPVGPVRFDLGYRVPGLQNLSGAEQEAPRVFGAPIAIHLTLGEAF